jgi:hypothetical protein
MLRKMVQAGSVLLSDIDMASQKILLDTRLEFSVPN